MTELAFGSSFQDPPLESFLAKQPIVDLPILLDEVSIFFIFWLEWRSLLQSSMHELQRSVQVSWIRAPLHNRTMIYQQTGGLIWNTKSFSRMRHCCIHTQTRHLIHLATHYKHQCCSLRRDIICIPHFHTAKHEMTFSFWTAWGRTRTAQFLSAGEGPCGEGSHSTNTHASGNVRTVFRHDEARWGHWILRTTWPGQPCNILGTCA